MAKKRIGHTRRQPTAAERERMRQAIAEESPAEVVAENKDLGRKLRSARDQRRKTTTAAVLAILAEIQRVREAEHISLAELAERAGMAKSNLSRLLNHPEPNVTIDTLERVAAALGRTVKIELEPR